MGRTARLRFGLALLAGSVALTGLLQGAGVAAAGITCATGWTARNGELCVLKLAYTGAPQTVTVPTGVAKLELAAIGAAGPGGYLEQLGYEGIGAGFDGEINVGAGEKLTAVVGGMGQVATSSEGGAGGYGGGGRGGNYEGSEPYFGGDGGGGGSFVFGPGNELLIAGGGGGGGGGGGDGGGGSGSRGCCNSGGGDPSLHGGLGGTQSAGGGPGNYPEVPDTAAPTAGRGPASGSGSFGEGGTGGSGKYASGSGGGGGYYGGGGGWPGGGSGGGGGSGYVAPSVKGAYASPGEPNSNGLVEFGYTLPTTRITGTITNPFKSGEGKQAEAGVRVQLSGSATEETTTGENGEYVFAVKPGTYTVTPLPTSSAAGKDEFETEKCAGKAAAGVCENITVAEGEDAVADFDAGFTVSGQVLGLEGKGVQGAKVVFQDEEQKTTQSASATTQAEGRFEARLAPGSVTAQVEPLQETQFFPVASGGSDPACVPSNLSCVVNLDHDRSIEFTACVLPNPNGSPLPASTPEKIPGAITTQNLEAVGCWKPQSDGNTYISTKPVRLDGLDLVPTSAGTQFELDKAAATVHVNGQANIQLKGIAIWPYVGGGTLNFKGSGVAVTDLGLGEAYAGFAGPRIAGVPLAVGTGGPLGSLVPPWSSTPGQTQLTLNPVVPVRANASSWNWKRASSTLANMSSPISDRSSHSPRPIGSV